MISDLFLECLEALKSNVTVLSSDESDKIITLFAKTVPIYEYGSRIDWGKISKKIAISNLSEVDQALKTLLHKDPGLTVYIFWNDASLPVIKTDLTVALEHFDDVVCVGFETWFFNPHEGYIIEYYYLDEMNVGLIT